MVNRYHGRPGVACPDCNKAGRLEYRYKNSASEPYHITSLPTHVVCKVMRPLPSPPVPSPPRDLYPLTPLICI